MTTLLPNGEWAIVNIRKIADYCLDDRALLVEFSDYRGRAYAVAPCREADLLVLHYVPEVA